MSRTTPADVLNKESSRPAADVKDVQSVARGVHVSREDGLQSPIDPEMITATTVIGERVMGSDGKALGKIEEIAMDITRGVISYFVLSAGGILGFASKFYAIPLNYLTLKPKEKTFYMDMDKNKLKQIPEIDKHNWPRKAQWPASDGHPQ